MDHAKRGADALASSDGLTALSSYTKALVEHPFSPDYFIQRSVAFTRLKPPRYDLSLRDAELALLLGQKRAKRESIQAAQQRRVVALYGLQQYHDAAFILQTMEKWRPNTDKDKSQAANKSKMEGEMWRAKINQKLKALPAAETKQPAPVTVKEYPEGPLHDEKTMKSWLREQLKSNGTYRFDGEEDVVADAEAPATVNSKATQQASSSESAVPKPIPHSAAPLSTTSVVSKIRHEWYQNAQSVTITLYAKGVARDKAKIDIQDDSVHSSPQNISKYAC